MGWDGMGWMGWDGMGWDGMGWDRQREKILCCLSCLNISVSRAPLLPGALLVHLPSGAEIRLHSLKESAHTPLPRSPVGGGLRRTRRARLPAPSGVMSRRWSRPECAASRS